MCEICHKTPCDPRCPMAPEPPEKMVGWCRECEKEIYMGDEVFKFSEGEYFCDDCISMARHTVNSLEDATIDLGDDEDDDLD